MYAEQVAQEMRLRGHAVKLIFSTCKEKLTNINMVVLQEEVDHQKRNKKSALNNANIRKVFWQERKRKNAVFFTESLGLDGGPLESSLDPGGTFHMQANVSNHSGSSAS